MYLFTYDKIVPNIIKTAEKPDFWTTDFYEVYSQKARFQHSLHLRHQGVHSEKHCSH